MKSIINLSAPEIQCVSGGSVLSFAQEHPYLLMGISLGLGATCYLGAASTFEALKEFLFVALLPKNAELGYVTNNLINESSFLSAANWVRLNTPDITNIVGFAKTSTNPFD